MVPQPATVSVLETALVQTVAFFPYRPAQFTHVDKLEGVRFW